MIVSICAIRPASHPSRWCVFMDLLIARPYRTLPCQRKGDFVPLVATSDQWFRIGDRTTRWFG